MAFTDKIASLMARPNEDLRDKNDVPWWLKYSARGLGSVGSFIAIFLGLWNCISVLLGNVSCLLGGMWQMVAGFLVIICEAPCCCLFIDFVQNLSEWVDKRPYWNRAACYVIIAIPAIIFCPSLSSIFGSGLIFATGILYGMMSLGKKAEVEEMARSATIESKQQPFENPKDVLVHNEQSIGVSKPPFDSKV